MKRRPNVFWQVTVAGQVVVVLAKTAGAAARRAFRELIRTPKRNHGQWRHHRPTAPLKRQPASELGGTWEDTRIEVVILDRPGPLVSA